jgi:hypothetical protein
LRALVAEVAGPHAGPDDQKIKCNLALTALVRFKTPVRERMAADFPRPKLRLRADLRVPSVAPNRPLMGIAYDYLLRFHLQRAFPFATAQLDWVLTPNAC